MKKHRKEKNRNSIVICVKASYERKKQLRPIVVCVKAFSERKEGASTYYVLSVIISA
jgi:hypothetical protein